MTITACSGGDSASTETTAATTEVETTMAETVEETVEPTEESTEAEVDPTIYITMNNTIETDKFVMSFESFDIEPELVFSTGSHSTFRVSPDEGEQVAFLKGHFENNWNSQIDTSDFKISFIANDDYTYDSSSVGFYFVSSHRLSIDPLAESDFYITAKIPDRLVDIIQTGAFYIKFRDDLTYINSSNEEDYCYAITVLSNEDTDIEAEEGETTDAEKGEDADSGDNIEEDNADDTEEAGDETKATSGDNVLMSIGDKIETKDYDFTLNNVELTYDLKPANTSGYYRHYDADSGKVYIHIDGDLYNKSKKDIAIRDLPIATADYDDGYTYSGFAIIDDGDNGFDYADSYVACIPLDTCHYHCLIECPEVIDTTDAPLFVLLPLADGITYKYDLR